MCIRQIITEQRRRTSATSIIVNAEPARSVDNIPSCACGPVPEAWVETGETPIQLDAMEAHTMKQVLRDAAAMDQIQLTLQRYVSQHTANGADTA